METPLEAVLTSFDKDVMTSFEAAHPEAFEEAVKLALSDKQPYSWRAAWLLCSCMEENDVRMRGHIKKIISSLKTREDGHQRELLKILIKMELNYEQEGRLFDACMNIWEAVCKQPSVRINALKIILGIVKKHPELVHEIDFLTQDHYLETLSPGTKHSVKKLMKEFTLK